MNSEDNKRAVMAAWQAFSSRDPERIAALFTQDAEWLAPKDNATAVALSLTDHMIGREQIGRFIGLEVGKLFSRDLKIEFKGFYADGNIVVVEERMQAILSNGAFYDNDYCFVFEVENGLIRRVREYMDTAKGHRMIFAQP